VRIDGADSSRLAGTRWLWQIANDAHPRVLEWSSSDIADRLVAEHEGYTRLASPVVHRRTIVFDKHRTQWRIVDELLGSGEHLVELFLHPAVTPLGVGDAVLLQAPRGDLWLFPPAQLSARQAAGWISRGYGHREPAAVLVYWTKQVVPLRIETTCVLVPSGTPASEARSLVQSD
jgi:hypothetical protein